MNHQRLVKHVQTSTCLIHQGELPLILSNRESPKETYSTLDRPENPRERAVSLDRVGPIVEPYLNGSLSQFILLKLKSLYPKVFATRGRQSAADDILLTGGREAIRDQGDTVQGLVENIRWRGNSSQSTYFLATVHRTIQKRSSTW